MSTIARPAPTIADRRQFIADLTLAEPPQALTKALTGRPSAFIVDGSLVSFVANISDQHKHDVLNATLLAQLAANKKFDRENQTVEWYSFYKTVLENVGWVVQEFEFDKLDTAGSRFTVDKVVLEILAAIASGDEMAIAKKTIDALKALDDGDGRLVLFETSSHSLQQGNFQILLAVDDGGVVALKMGCFHFSSSDQCTRVLWFSFSSASASFYKGAQAISLNEDVYSRVRDDIIVKLGDRAVRFVKEVEI
jgi:hypothetical protein